MLLGPERHAHDGYREHPQGEEVQKRNEQVRWPACAAIHRTRTPGDQRLERRQGSEQTEKDGSSERTRPAACRSALMA
jgi:hypothetical protein